MQPPFTLREMRLADGPALSKLFQDSPDTGMVSVYSHFPINPYDAFTALHEDAIGVVAEHESGGLAGFGLVSFGQTLFEGELHDYAFLSSLVVHPNYRGQGIASALAEWRVNLATERIGSTGIIFAGIQQDNKHSFAVARKWATETIGPFHGSFVGMRTKPPAGLPGITVRPIELSELTQLARHLNQFYEGYNLYPPQNAETLTRWIGRTLGSEPFHHYYVAVNQEGDLLAGLALAEEYKAKEIRVMRPPKIMEWLNTILHLVPTDGKMQQIAVNKMWFALGQAKAAQFLWETIRWQWREHGQTLIIYYDPCSPLAKTLKIPFWIPTGKIILAIKSSEPTVKTKPIYPPA